MKKLLILMVFILGLSCGHGMYEYGSVSPEPKLQTYRDIPLYVDKDFSPKQQNEIRNAIIEWNHALNGYLNLKLMTWTLDYNSEYAKNLVNTIDLTDEGIIIVAAKHNDPILHQMQQDGPDTLAFVDRLGNKAHYIVMIVDKIGERNFHKIMLHEFGHAMGAMHVTSRSLMFPYYGPYQRDCIDKITILQVSNYHNLDPKYMNYCSTPFLP